MAAKRVIDTVFWEDGYIMEQLSHDEKYFLLYLMTNPKSTQLGIYGLPKRVICFDTGFDLEAVNGMLDRLAKEHRFIAYDDATQELALLSSLKYSILKSGKPVRDCLEQELERVEQPALVLENYQHMKS